MSIEISKLKNGLPIVTDYMQDVETVCITFRVRTGSRYESKKYNGLSHFIEHMCFKGTNKRTAKQIAEDFDNLGGIFNAYTSMEYTVYYCKILKENAEKAMEILSDILLNSKYAEEDIEKERGVILQEIAASKDDPSDMASEYFYSTLYPNQAIGRSIAGSEKNVKSFQREDFIKYIEERYNNESILVSIAGKFKHEEARKIAEKYLLNIKKGKYSLPKQAEYVGGDFRKQKKLEQIQFLMGFNSFGYLDDRMYTAKILSGVLGSGQSSRLFQEAREKRGLCYYIAAFNSSNMDSGVFGISSGVSAEKINELIDTIATELKKATEKISDEELNRTKIRYKTRILMAMESSSERAFSNGFDYQVFNRVKTVEEIVEKINLITKKDLYKMMEDILKTKPTITLYGDIKNAYSYDEIVKKL